MPSHCDVDLFEAAAKIRRGHTPTTVKNPDNARFGTDRMLPSTWAEINSCDLYSRL
jgi:hypothetical protein